MIDKTILHYKILENIGEASPACADVSAGTLLKTCSEEILEVLND